MNFHFKADNLTIMLYQSSSTQPNPALRLSVKEYEVRGDIVQLNAMLKALMLSTTQDNEDEIEALLRRTNTDA